MQNHTSKRICKICNSEFIVEDIVNRSGRIIPRTTKYCSTLCVRKANCLKVKRYNERNRETVSSRKRLRRSKPEVKILESKQKRQWEKKHPGKKAEWGLRYRAKNASRKSVSNKNYRRKEIDQISDRYIKKLFKWGNPKLKLDDPPQSMIEQRRKIIKLKRTINEVQRTTNAQGNHGRIDNVLS